MIDNWASLNPCRSTSDGGKKLLQLLKSVEQGYDKHDAYSITSDIESLECDIIDILSSLRNVYMHHGLLQGNSDRATEIDTLISSKANNQSSDSMEGKGGRKRKRGRSGGGSKDVDIISLLSTDGSSASAGQEGLVLSNISRVLVPSSASSTSSDEFINKYAPAIITEAADVMTAICQHCSFHRGSSATARVEYDIITSISTQLLRGLGKTMQSLLRAIASEDQDVESDMDHALCSCCRCASILVELINVRLNRSNAIIQMLQASTEKILWQAGSSTNMVDSAANLLTKLPLTSDSNGTLPTKLWEDGLSSTISSFSTTLHKFFPTSRKSKQSANHEVKMDWIEEVSTTVTSQSSRMLLFTQRIRGYTSLITGYMTLNARSVSDGASTLRACSIPLTGCLELLETMLMFQNNAESRVSSTKTRLRDISTKNGLLSPNAALTVANLVVDCGFSILDTLLSIVQNASLQHGRRFVRLAVSFLQSCSSGVLRKALDPVVSGRNRWSVNSVYLQIRSIRSFVRIMQTLGSSAIVTSSANVERGLTYIVGSLLEQISQAEGHVDGDSWGTINEQVELVQACIDGISSCLSVFKGFMKLQVRQTIESVTTTCLSYLENSDSSLLFFRYDCIKISVMKLAVNSISTPWPDGGASTLVGLLHRMALSLRHDSNTCVSDAAYSVLNTCELSFTPRANPMVIVSRDLNAGNDQREEDNGGMIVPSQEDIVGDINQVRDERARAARESNTKESKASGKTSSATSSIKQAEKKPNDINVNIKSSSEAKPPPLIPESTGISTAVTNPEIDMDIDSGAKSLSKPKPTEGSPDREGNSTQNGSTFTRKNEASGETSIERENRKDNEELKSSSMMMKAASESSDDDDDDFPDINVDCDPDI